MVNIRRSDPQNSKDSSKREVTDDGLKTPIHSVKRDASFFGNAAVSWQKDAPRSSENVLDKETQLHLAQRELSSIKTKLETAETANARALLDFGRAKRMLRNLSAKLQAVNNSNQSANGSREDFNHQFEQHDVHTSRGPPNRQLKSAGDPYVGITTKTNSSERRPVSCNQDFGAAMEAKDRDNSPHGDKRVNALKQERGDYVNRSGKDLAVKTAGIENLRVQMKQAHTLVTNASIISCKQQNISKKTTRESSNEESSIRSWVNSLKTELESLRREIAEMELKKAQRTALDGENFQCKLREENSKAERTILAAGNAYAEAKEMRKKAQELKQEAETTRVTTVEAEKKLELALKMAEEAKAAEKKAIESKILSEEHRAQLEDTAKIKLSVHDYESLKGKVKESENLIEMKAAAVASQLQAIYLSKQEADKKLAESLKFLEELRAAVDMVVKSAKSTEAEKREIEAEIRKLRQEH